MSSRPRIWLKINGKVNTLLGHLAQQGISRHHKEKLARQHKCKASNLPITALEYLFSAKVEKVEQPENWQEIMYGSDRGAQRNKPPAKTKVYYEPKKEKAVSKSVVHGFMTAKLTGYQLETVTTYY